MQRADGPAMARLEAHIAALNARPAPLPSTPPPMEVGAHEEPGAPAAAEDDAAPLDVPDQLALIEDFFDSLDAPPPPRPRAAEAADTNRAPAAEQYDHVVQQVVRRAWDTAWSDFTAAREGATALRTPGRSRSPSSPPSGRRSGRPTRGRRVAAGRPASASSSYLELHRASASTRAAQGSSMVRRRGGGGGGG